MHGFSDIFSINASSIKRFSHLCGVFSSVGLFVEIAIPTTLALCTKKLVTMEDLDMLHIPFWYNYKGGNNKQVLFLGQLFQEWKKDLQLLLDIFPEKLLYIHPIKLSEFNTSKLL